MGESRGILVEFPHAIYAFFSLRSRGFSSRRYAGDPNSETRGLRELRVWVRLVLTGPSDKGGG